MTPTLKNVLRGTSRPGFSNSAESWAMASQPNTAKTSRLPRAPRRPTPPGRRGPVVDAHARDGGGRSDEQEQGDAAAQGELHPPAYPQAVGVGRHREREHRRSQKEGAAPPQARGLAA